MVLFASFIGSEEAEPMSLEGDITFCIPLENFCMIVARSQILKEIEK